MPYIKSRDIHVTPNRSLNYICDPKKTQGGLNIVSVNCMPDPRNAYEEMKRIYEYYSRHRFNESKPKKGKARVKLIHYIQSFDPKDNVSIETAQQIALDTIKDMFGENAQAVIATHDDTGKVHNHIMLNVFDLTGKRFHSCKESLKKIKEVSDEVCQRYGIKPFDRENYVRKPIISGYHEWVHLRNGTSWKQQIRDKIDELIPVADSYEDVRSRMEVEGFTFKDGKYVCVKAPGQERFARLKTIGDNYTPENIAKRIAAAKGEKVERFSRGFFNVSVEINARAGAYRITKPIKDMCGTFVDYYSTIHKEHLESIGMVQAKLKAWEKKCVDIQNQIRELEEKIGKIEQEVKAAYHYFDNMSGLQRMFPHKEKDKAAVAVVKEHDFGNKYVVEIYARQLDTMKAKLSELKDQLTSAGGEVRKYKEISDTFEMMRSEENYSERLTREAKDNISRTDWDAMIEEKFNEIKAEIEKPVPSGLFVMEDVLRKKIAKLRTMNIDQSEINKLVRVLAIMRIDGINCHDDVHELTGKMKVSANAAYKDYKAYQELADELNEPIKYAEIYVKFHDNPGNLDEGYIEYCRKRAEEHCATTEYGLKGLIAKRDELRKKADEARKKANYYSDRAADYDSILQAVRDIEIYPPERKPEEKKTQTPKKKIRR